MLGFKMGKWLTKKFVIRVQGVDHLENHPMTVVIITEMIHQKDCFVVIA